MAGWRGPGWGPECGGSAQGGQEGPPMRLMRYFIIPSLDTRELTQELQRWSRGLRAGIWIQAA